MANLLLIVFCLAAGLLLQRLPSTPTRMAHSLNAFVINLSLPALVLTQAPALVAKLRPGADLFVPASMAWLQIVLSAAIFAPLGPRLGWSRRVTGSVILMAGFGNTSFVGIPLIEALVGPAGLPTVLIADQFGSFLAIATAGVLIASFYGSARTSPRIILRRVGTFPPFIALVAALALSWLAPGLLSLVSPALRRLGDTIVPLALVSVGLQLSFEKSALRGRALPLSLGLFVKLFLVPLVLSGLYLGALGLRSLSTRVTLLESAMAPMITAAIVAAELGLDVELANLMVGVGVPISLLSVWLWSSALPK